MEYKWKKSGLGMKELFRKFVENMKNGKIKKDRLLRKKRRASVFAKAGVFMRVKGIYARP